MKIELKNLHKSFGSKKVLNGVNLTIEPGEITVILGRSGQGKSVMLKHLIGLVAPDEGEILIDGVNIAKLSERELFPYRMRFGMIFQNAGLLQSLTVAQNVSLPLIEVRGTDRSKVMDQVREKLKMVDLEGVEDQAVTTLSGGQRKRVAIARALVQNADCMLFDEPTAGLDPPISQTVDDVILKVNEETKATVIVVTHDLISAFYVGQKIYLLDKGRVVHSGTPEDFRDTDNEVVREFFQRGVTVTEARQASRSRVSGLQKLPGK